jgi:DNA-directed RNA polymerase subunit RPC12/RpoP
MKNKCPYCNSLFKTVNDFLDSIDNDKVKRKFEEELYIHRKDLKEDAIFYCPDCGRGPLKLSDYYK